MKCFLSILFCALALCSRSQFKMGPQLFFGRAGASLITSASDGTGTGSNWTKRKGGYNFSGGIIASNRVSNTIVSSYDLCYNKASWKDIVYMDAQDPSEFYRDIITYHSINFSTSLNYATTLGKGKVFIGAGLGLQYILKGKVEELFKDAPYFNDTTELVFEQDESGLNPNVVNKWQPIFTANMGYILGNNIQFSIRYNTALSKFYNNSSFSSRKDTKINSIGLQVAYLFEWKRKRQKD